MTNGVQSPTTDATEDLSAPHRIWVQRGPYRLAVTDHPGREPAFVLLHGFPDDSHLWDALVPHLDGRRVVTFDFLGWCESDKPRDH